MTEFLFPTREQALLYLRSEGFKPMREHNWINFGARRAASLKDEHDCTRIVVIAPHG